MAFGSIISYTPRTFVFEGDSHTYGNLDPANAWPVFLNAFPLFTPCPFKNFAQNGWRFANVATDYPISTPPYWTSNTRVPANFWLHIGSNDVAQNTSGAAIYAGVAPILAAAKLNGFFVGCTSPWNDPAFTAGQTAALLAYRNLLAVDASITSGLFLDGNDMFPSGAGHLNPIQQAFYAQTVYNLLIASGNIL